MTKAETATIPDAPMTPMRQLILGIGPSVQAAFFERFSKPIEVYAASTKDGVTYRFEMAKPGLLRTAIEKAWFEAYIAAWRHAAALAFSLYEPEGEVN